MPRPSELVSRVLKPLPKEQQPEATPVPPTYGTTIERVEYDGDIVRRYRFDPVNGERVDELPAADFRLATSPMSAADALSVERQLRGLA